MSFKPGKLTLKPGGKSASSNLCTFMAVLTSTEPLLGKAPISIRACQYINADGGAVLLDNAHRISADTILRR